MLTLQDIEEIKADAEKAITRQFRDAAEDLGWKPTPTPDLDSGTQLVEEPKEVEKAPVAKATK